MKSNRYQVEWIRPQDLIACPDNPRVHPRKQRRKFAAMIRRFGFVSVILINENNVIIAGHLRCDGAIEAGIEEVPCIRVTGLSERDKKALMLADNRLPYDATWDSEKLATVLSDVIPCDFDFDSLGFDQAEIDNILIGSADASTKPASPEDKQIVPPAADAVVTRYGDKWILGNHHLLCGSSSVPQECDRLMGKDRARMTFADPPYNVRINGHVGGLGAIQHREFAEASGELSSDEYVAWLIEICTQIERLCVNGAIVYICIDWRHLQELLAAGRTVFADLKNLIVWAKTNAGMGTFYRSQHELILVWKVGDQAHTNNFGLGETGRHRSNVWTYPGVNTFRAGRMEELKSHPTPKNVEMVADAIRDVSNRGEIVLDPFGGSGTTLIAAEKTGRCARLMEIDPAYCDSIIERWQTFTGKTAMLDGTWNTFEQIKAERLGALELESGN